MADGTLLATVADVRAVALPKHQAETGTLVVLEGDGLVPFSIARVFVVQTSPGAVRGQHAHKRCTQFFICTSGAVDVHCDDGVANQVFRLSVPEQGLLIPPGIWAEEHYREAGTVLMVLCDLPYDKDDYVRDRQEFLAYRRAIGQDTKGT